MRHARTEETSDYAERGSPGRKPLSIGDLAHELNSLLDGSLRCLALAKRAIEASDYLPQDDVATRLRSAEDGMKRMAGLLERAMRSPSPDLALFDERQPLGSQIDQIMESLSPWAGEHGVNLRADVLPQAGAMRSSMLGPVILNGMRNAIQACAASQGSPKRVELAVTITPARELLILIADTGPGAPQEPVPEGMGFAGNQVGHGRGLQLCHRIVKDLDGTLLLTNIPFGTGAVLRATIPLGRLTTHG